MICKIPHFMFFDGPTRRFAGKTMTIHPKRLTQISETMNYPPKILRRFFSLFIVTLLIFICLEICPNFVSQSVFAQSESTANWNKSNWDNIWNSWNNRDSTSFNRDSSSTNADVNWIYNSRNSNNSSLINNYVNSYDNTPTTYNVAVKPQPPNEYYGNADVYIGDRAYFYISPQPEPGGYLAMGNRPVFQQNNAQTLTPRYPLYDHWSEISGQPWTTQLLPQGLIFPSYLAGMKESRIATMWVHDDNFQWVWDATLGGRAGILRFGTPNAVLPEGVQLDIEGAVQLRMDMEHGRNMMANDFRAGVPLTFGNRKWQFKTGYYHVSSHMGDHHMLRTGEIRINYVRDSLVLAVARRFWNDCRAYADTAWAFYTGVETDPWEFQFGLEYAPIYPACGFRGTPFAAINLHLFQELNYSGYLCCQAGWQWRGASNQLFRLGLQYMNGYDDQFQFHRLTTNKIGFGVWYDF